MDLEQHPTREPRLRQPRLDVEHRDLDDVGRRPLDRGVERHALRHLATLPVGGPQVGQVAAPAEQRLRVAGLASLRDDAHEVVAHAAELLEVLVHEDPRLGRLDAQLLRQTESAQPVREAVVHGLDARPLGDRHGVGGHAEDSRRHHRVEVVARAERLDKSRVVGRVGHDPHLDLAVVGRDQRLVALPDDERLTDPASCLRPYRDVLQVRVGRAQPAGRGDRLYVRGVDTAVVRHGLLESLDGLTQPDRVAVLEQVGEERVPRLRVQPLERVRVRRVAALELAGLRHVQLVEEHRLELLGRTEVDLLADDVVRGRGGGRDAVVEPAPQLVEQVGVDGDPRALHRRERAEQWQLDVAYEQRPPLCLQLDPERLGEVDHGAGPEHGRLRDLHRVGRLVAEVEHELVVGITGRTSADLGAQLTLQVTQGEVAQVVRALVGSQQVGRHLGVAHQSVEVPATCPDGQQRPLGVVDRLRVSGIGQPSCQRRVVVGAELRDVEVGSSAVGTRERQRHQVAGAAPPATDRLDPREHAGAMSAQPCSYGTGLEHVADDLEPTLGRGLLSGQDLEQPVAQHPELQPVEQAVHCVAVPVLPLEVGAPERQVEVAQQGVDPTVRRDVVEVLAERLPRFARHVGRLPHEVLEPVVHVEPLRGRLRPDPGHARQVVARLTDQRREVGVALRGDEVLLLHGRRRHTGEVGDALAGVEHRHVVVDELERVAVAGDDEHVEPVLDRLRRERRNDVVGLVAVELHVDHVQRVQDLLDERHLPRELGRGRRPVALVRRVQLRAERHPGHVERHGQVGRRLVAQHVDEHRREPVHGIGVLARRRREVLHGQGEERSVRDRVAVDEQESRPLKGLHRHAGDSIRLD